MPALTLLGTVHTAISLVALWAGVWSLLRDGAIDPRVRLGRVYLWTTVATCLTGFGIFQNGGFNEAHALGAITLVVIAVAMLPLRIRPWPYVQTGLWTLTLFFHMVPGLKETFTRLPAGNPLFNGAEDPRLQASVAAAFAACAIVVVVQTVQRRRRSRTAATRTVAADA